MRRQLVLMTLAVTSIVVIAFVLPLGFLVRTIAADRAISQANADAQNVGQLIAGNRSAAPALVAQADASSRGRIAVYYADGVVVGDSSPPPDADSLTLARRGRSFSRSWSGGVDVFLPVLGAGRQTAVVRVSVANRELERGVWIAWWLLAALGAVLIGVAVVVADRMARSITKPMQTLTESARRLAGGDLEERSRVQGPRKSSRSVARSMRSPSRIGDLLRAEREHAANLSHSLADSAHRVAVGRRATARQGRGQTDHGRDRRPRERRDERDRRYAPRTEDPQLVAVDLGQVVGERLTFWRVLTRAQQRALDVHLHPEPLSVNVHRRDLEQLVDVLVGNVLRHTEAGCAVRVTTAPRTRGRRPSRRGGCGSGLSHRHSRRDARQWLGPRNRATAPRSRPEGK